MTSPRENSRNIKWVQKLAGVLFAIGLVARLAPLTNVGGRILRQFPTEDGYLMLTIARNLAIGNGMTVSDGTIATNGTQPLATLIWSVVFWIFGGSRTPSVLVIQMLQVGFAMGTAYALHKLCLRVVKDERNARLAGWLAPALWFASPVVLPHTMNCLETGLYTLLLTSALYGFSVDRSKWSLGRFALFGVMLGFTFLARMDASFFIGALCLIHLFVVQGDGSFGKRLSQTVLMGAISVVVASPWLIYNVTQFDHLIPISGQSEALGAGFGENARLAVTVLFEYTFIILPIPMVLGENDAIVALAAIVLLACAMPAWLFAKKQLVEEAQGTFYAGAIFSAGIFLYYGFFFGAPWFVNRYFAPLSPWLAVLTTTASVAGILEGKKESLRRLATPLLWAAAFVCAALQLRVFMNGGSHQHFQVVEWVAKHVTEDEWVAAPQSGTLGFFHERSLNLDGKVSHGALMARRAGKIPEYALEKGTRYFADWNGLETWADLPALKGKVELLVHDPEANLVVLRVLDAAERGRKEP